MTLSVILANYNHAHYIGDALDAILSQSYRPSEVIVIDDGSTDNSVELIQQFARRDPILRLYQNDRNRGALYSVNRALGLATGDYVYSAASDDRVLPGFLEKSMNLLAEHPEAGLCCSDPAILDERTGIISEDRYHWSETPCYFSPTELAELISGWYIAGHTAVVKRSAILGAGGFVPELKWYCDWFLCLTIAFRYGICYIPDTLATIRRRGNSYSAAGQQDSIQQRETLSRLLHLVKSPSHRDVLPHFVRSAAFTHFGPAIVKTLMSKPEHWDAETLLLLRYPLYEWAEQVTAKRQEFQAALNSPLRGTLWKLTPWVLGLCARDGVKRVFIYGAGSHTEEFLRVWKLQGGPSVEGIIVSEPNGAREFRQVPILSAAEFKPEPGDGIVLSSANFEPEMAAQCRSKWPNTPYYPLYSEL